MLSGCIINMLMLITIKLLFVIDYMFSLEV
jgi:hypothetical protein